MYLHCSLPVWAVKALKGDYTLRCGPFLSLDNLEFNLLPIGKRLKAFPPNDAVMHKDISTIGALDKAKTFSVVEPFDGSGLSICHECTILY